MTNHGSFSDRRPVLMPGKNGSVMPSKIAVDQHQLPGPPTPGFVAVPTPDGRLHVLTIGGTTLYVEVARQAFQSMLVAGQDYDATADAAFSAADAFIRKLQEKQAAELAQQKPAK